MIVCPNLDPILKTSPPFLPVPFQEYEKIRVVFAGMGLLQQSADPGFAGPNDDEQVFGNEVVSSQLVDDFDMCQPLLVGTDLVLTFDD